MTSDETMSRYGANRILQHGDTVTGSPLRPDGERSRWSLEDEIAVAMIERKRVKVLHCHERGFG